MLIYTAAAPPFMKNGFVLACERTKEAVYIDPGDEVDGLLARIADEGVTVKAILITHAHVDHVSGVARAKGALQAPIWLHPDDTDLYGRAVADGLRFGLRIEAPPPVDRFFAGDGHWGAFGDYLVAIHHTPGHCPGNVCFAVRSATSDPSVLPDLFVGDTLFAGSIGRTDLPGGDYETLLHAIVDVLLPFGDEARVFPGHGEETTIGDERRTNPFVLEWLARQR